MQPRHFVLSTASAGLALAHPLARAQALPERATILAGFAPGGTVDVTARRVADKLRDALAKSVVVENPAADFQPVSQAVRFDFGFAVGPMVPASVQSLAEFVAWCQAHPKDANFGSPAAGSVPHFVAELFGRAAGVDLEHVPYRGTQPAIADLIGGQVASVSGPVGEFLQHLPGGQVRLLATSGAGRSKFAPTVATYAEQGFKGIVFDEWFGFYMPAKVPGELADLLEKDSERWAPLIKAIGFTADS